MQGLTPGRVVHYVLRPDHDGTNPLMEGQHRPAIVVRTSAIERSYVNLQVFIDGLNDNATNPHPVWRQAVRYSEKHEPGTWHWIERA